MKQIVCTIALCLSTLIAPCLSSADEYSILTADLPPWSFQDGTGIYGDVVAEIERRIGSGYKPHVLPWSRAQRMTKTGRNHMIYPLTRTADREPQYQWIIDVTPMEMAFVSYQGKALDVQQAKKLDVILVHQDTPPHTFLKKEGFTNLHTLPFGGGSISEMLKRGRGDAWFSAVAIAAYNVKERPDVNSFVFGPSIGKSRMYLACSKDFPQEVINQYRYFFKEMKADGTFREILSKYLGTNIGK